MERPYFSIGVTTYKRRELLTQTLASIRNQTFGDYEVIVGNDDTQEPLSGGLLGIEDSRIRFVNHPQNLGEMKNMNSLLRAARGQYFTWLADDDLYAPAFLQVVHSALIRFDFPACVFTSYAMGATFLAEESGLTGEQRLVSGRQFLREYLAGSLRTLGGVFDTEYLRRTGGMEQLGKGFSPYSDALVAIRAGLLEKVVHIDAPLIFFRTHEGSISWTSGDVDAYSSAQDDLCRECITVFGSEGLRADFGHNLFRLLQRCIGDFAEVRRRSGSVNSRMTLSYLRVLRPYIRALKGSGLYWKVIGFLMRTIVRSVSVMSRAQLSRWLRSSDWLSGWLAKTRSRC